MRVPKCSRGAGTCAHPFGGPLRFRFSDSKGLRLLCARCNPGDVERVRAAVDTEKIAAKRAYEMVGERAGPPGQEVRYVQLQLQKFVDDADLQGRSSLFFVARGLPVHANLRAIRLLPMGEEETLRRFEVAKILLDYGANASGLYGGPRTSFRPVDGGLRREATPGGGRTLAMIFASVCDFSLPSSIAMLALLLDAFDRNATAPFLELFSGEASALAPPAGEIGLCQLGNTCYFNSAVQFLSTPLLGHHSALRQRVDRHPIVTLAMILRLPVTPLGSLLKSEVVTATHAAYERFITRRDHAGEAVQKEFTRGRQEDAQAAVVALLHDLKGAAQDDSKGAAENEEAAVFSAKEISIVRCPRCDLRSRTTTANGGIFSLPVSSPAGVLHTTLDMCLAAWNERENLDDELICDCPSAPLPCPEDQRQTKQLFVTAPSPEWLIVHLKRFEVNADETAKLTQPIAFPLRGLNVRPVMEEQLDANDPLLYDLYALLLHRGDTYKSGHNTAWVLSSDGVTFRLYNDSVVRDDQPSNDDFERAAGASDADFVMPDGRLRDDEKAKEAHKVQKDVYLLLYRRREPADAPPLSGANDELAEPAARELAEAPLITAPIDAARHNAGGDEGDSGDEVMAEERDEGDAMTENDHAMTKNEIREYEARIQEARSMIHAAAMNRDPKQEALEAVRLVNRLLLVPQRFAEELHDSLADRVLEHELDYLLLKSAPLRSTFAAALAAALAVLFAKVSEGKELGQRNRGRGRRRRGGEGGRRGRRGERHEGQHATRAAPARW
jgi:hypothetical protein